MNPLISVIVPVFNVEDYLPRCLDSLRNQSIYEIEFILIDDASVDSCGEICEKYSAKDSRFKVIHHLENKGLSAARNAGIQIATADYLMFVDSDDYVHKDFCWLPYECAVKTHSDLVMFRLQHIKKSKGYNQHLNDEVNSRQSGCITQIEAIELLHDGVGHTAMNKLYQKSFFNTISYPIGSLYEDVGTTYKTVLQANSIYYLDKVLYYHCYRFGSITTIQTEKSLRDFFEMSMQQYRDLTAWGYPSDKLDFFLKDRTLAYCKKYYSIRKLYDSDFRYLFCKRVLCSSKDIPSKFRRQNKVLFVLFKYCRPLFFLSCLLYDKYLRSVCSTI